MAKITLKGNPINTGKVVYTQPVPEIVEEPDYESA